MYPPIFQLITASTDAKKALGTSPTRFYPFGTAPENVALPYAVWQTVSGYPENYLGETPDVDQWTIQVDVYAATATSARSTAQVLRDAIEPHAHITAWRGESRDPETGHYRYSFDVDFLTPR